MGKCELFSFVLKIILLRHKVGLCLHGHIFDGSFDHYCGQCDMRPSCLQGYMDSLSNDRQHFQQCVQLPALRNL